MLRKFALSIFAAGCICAGVAQTRLSGENQEMGPDRKIALAERIIESYYIDDVEGDKIAQEAIKAMLKTLDPHSTYSDAEETKALTTPLEGNFSGIGIQFNINNDTIYVLQTTAGGPSERVGMLPGDRILSADGKPLSGVKISNADVLKTLRGTKGTKVKLDVARKGVAKPITFVVKRDVIPIYSVDAAYMADPTTGYIRISRFAETTDEEFSRALSKLKAQGMRNLIIDLEDNGGGYLGSAVSLASHFLNKGDLVTYTEGPKIGVNRFEADRKGDFDSGRLVVMVNQYSASASEIFSGAMQDHDRGLIVGRRTFGKGLVQRPFPFPDGSMIRLTVSRYHTPSGRVIQKPYEAGNFDAYQADMKNRYEKGEFSSSASVELPDSLRFTTLRRHRPVYGGGGIMPDLFVPVDTTSYTDYYRDLIAKGVITSTAINYVDEHRRRLLSAFPDVDTYVEHFDITPAMLDVLIANGKKEGVEYNQEQWQKSRPAVAAILKGLIARDIYDTGAYYEVVNPLLNPIYRAALDLINTPAEYTRLLSGAIP